MTPRADPGGHPDPRFTLANERTVLAWLRTAIALIAGGLGLVAVRPPLPPPFTEVLAVALLLFGAGVAAASYPAGRRRQQALGRGGPVRLSAVGAVISGAVVLAAIALGVGLLLV